MWWFRTKPVVHVDVSKHPNNPKLRVASFRYGSPSDPVEFTFEPEPFRYSEEIRNRVIEKVTPTLSPRQLKRLQIKIWRDNDSRKMPPLEIGAARVVGVGLIVALIFFVGVLIYVDVSQTPVESLIPGTALAAIAVAAATLFGNWAVRLSKLSEPFEYRPRQAVHIYGPLLGSIFVNLLLLVGVAINWTSLLPDALVSGVKIVLSILGLVLAVVGAGLHGALETLRWLFVEDVQRRHPEARQVVDFLENRKRVGS